MALIICPKCRQSISDKAQKCPRCGFPLGQYPESGTEGGTLAKADAAAGSVGTASVTGQVKPKKKGKKIVLIVVIAAVVVAAVMGILWGSGLFSPKLTVQDISISKWRLTDSDLTLDYYAGTVTSEQKAPFIAVIGMYADDGVAPYFIYMEDGTGTLETMEFKEDDPSLQYKAIGYLSGEVIHPSDISVKYTDENYSEWSYSESTRCDVWIDISMKNSKTGLLVFDIINETTNETRTNNVAPVVNGEAEFYYWAELPYKGRGVDITVVPRLFCQAAPVAQEDYVVEKPYAAEKEETEYSVNYSGEEILSFPNYADGFILYTEELTEGGDSANRNIVKNQRVFLHNGECTLSTYDPGDKEDSLLMPKYSFHILGYITWTQLEKEAN